MELVFATNNNNKLQEVQAMLDNITLTTLNDINCTEDIPETSPTIKGNAIQKINYITQYYSADGFADDTGLEIEALNNEPGVYSARYAGEEKSAEANMNLVLERLQNHTNKKARFVTVIALNLNREQYLFEGICNGTITSDKRGEKGFGYDPIFIPDGFTKTFAEMSQDEKAQVSHRGKAVRQLIDFLNKL
ncbi:MAG: non-canonical purine NTP diphosphatase [Flavobacteriaceae bacterium]